MTLEPGAVIRNNYKIETLLAAGGNGAVYKAYDAVHNCYCAIKEINLTKYAIHKNGASIDHIISHEKTAIQFEREAKLLSGFDQVNLPKVTDYFSEGPDLHYLVMNWIAGKDLAGMMETRRGQPFAETQLLEWIVQVMNALSYCHKNNFIHRDVKPSNIIIGEANRAYLVDFGIAKNINKPGNNATIGTQILTSKYNSPEQYTDQGMIDARSDIYALGASMYTLVTGKQPIEAVLRVMGNKQNSPREIIPSVSPVLDAVITRAMEIKQDQRYQSIEEMRAAIFSAPYLLNSAPKMRNASKEPDTLRLLRKPEENEEENTVASLEIINRSLIKSKIVYKVKDSQTKIGRTALNSEAVDIDLASLDQGRIISRVHAVVECRNRHYFLKDNKSHNGTWVNGQKLQENQDYLLKDGDDIRFGSQQPHGIQAIFRQKHSD